jgi:hypothetical protein
MKVQLIEATAPVSDASPLVPVAAIERLLVKGIPSGIYIVVVTLALQ